jgi:hypothetical protein
VPPDVRDSFVPLPSSATAFFVNTLAHTIGTVDIRDSGHVLAELHLEGVRIFAATGSSWLVPVL